MHEEIWTIFGSILLILALAGIVIPVMQRFRISSVIGYLLCGLVIGPYGLGVFIEQAPWLSAVVITDLNTIQGLAELGVVFLLFMIGLELTFSRLWDMRRLVLGLGNLQILITALVIFFVALQFGNKVPTAILIGAAFALSSTAMVMQLLTDRHMISLPVGRLSFSVLLMQDLAVVPILVLIGTFSGHSGGSVLVSLLQALVTAGVVVAVIIAIGKLFLKPVLRMLSPSDNVEWLFAIVLFLVIGSASLTHSFGLSAALGAFLAGLLIAETEYRHEIEVIIEPVKGLLMGVFFLSVGMATDITAVIQHPVWLAASVIGIFLIKAVIFFPIALLFAIPAKQAIHASILLAQCGEFAFIVIGLAQSGNLLPKEDAQFFLLVASISLLLTPLTTRLAPLAEGLLNSRDTQHSFAEPEGGLPESDHLIIAGFGRVGQTLARVLEDQKIPYIAIDVDGLHVHKLRSQGYSVIFGDARKMELWNKLNVSQASAAVVTIDDFPEAETIVRSLRHKWPLVSIIVRVQNTLQLSEYYEAGATTVVPETLEATMQLVRTLMIHVGIEEQEATEVINRHRKEILTRDT